jgi:hypothetical protein
VNPYAEFCKKNWEKMKKLIANEPLQEWYLDMKPYLNHMLETGNSERPEWEG